MNTALIVDDELEIGKLLARFLSKTDIEAEYVERIGLAKQKIIENQYSLFFLDLNLPDGSGFDLIPLIKQRYKNSHIIIISAYDGLEEQQKALELQTNAFLSKPFTKKEVLSLVETLS